MQQCVNHFSRACDNFGVTISSKKTEVMQQPAPRKVYHEPHTFVNDEPQKATDSFTYLGCALSREANIDVEVNNRLSKSQLFIWKTREESVGRIENSQETKLKVYMAVVLTVLLYACESSIVYSRHARKLNHFHTKCLRTILNIKWQDMAPDTEALTRAGIPSIHTLLQKAKVRWSGHVTRMPDDRLPKTALIRRAMLRMLCWQGKGSGEHREYGVGFAVRNSLLIMIEPGSNGSERLLTLRLNTTAGPLTLVSVYAPTMSATSNTKYEFSENLAVIISSVPNNE